MVLKKGRALKVTDVDGHTYTDFTSCFGVLALGHCPPVVQKALTKQAAKMIHGMGDVHPTPSKVALLTKLAALAPFPQAQSILSCSGGEAIESAMKTALLKTGRTGFVSFSGGYHGLHFGPLSLCNRTHFTNGFENFISKNNVTLPFPQCPHEAALLRTLGATDGTSGGGAEQGTENPEVVTLALERYLKTKQFAAVVLEPVQGRGGERVFSASFLKSVKDLCHTTGTLLIYDEIFSGFGRTGGMFAWELSGVKPDILVTGKALGGGLPLSACTADASLMQVWGQSTGEARHTSTFLGHPLACAAGFAQINAVVSLLPGLQKNLGSIEQIIQEWVAAHNASYWGRQHPVVARGTGWMRGLWFVKSPPGFVAQVSKHLMHHGFLTLPSGYRGDVLSLVPPLIVTPQDFSRLLKALRQVLVGLGS